MGHFAAGVTVITAVDGGRRFGTTSAVSSLSLQPPMLLICMNRQSSTDACVSRVGRFAVNILTDEQADLARRFAARHPTSSAAYRWPPGPREPLLAGALAHVECRVVEEIAGASHIVFTAEAHRGSAATGTPLAYYRGRFGPARSGPDGSTMSAPAGDPHTTTGEQQ